MRILSLGILIKQKYSRWWKQIITRTTTLHSDLSKKHFTQSIRVFELSRKISKQKSGKKSNWTDR